MDFPDHPFWNFSVTAHQRPGVHEACLYLQTRYVLDVNLLFFCCWVGAAGGGILTPEQIHGAMEAVSGWQEEIVRPIWRARWRLKPSFATFPVEKTEPLRRCLIQAELDAEHIEQLQLAETVTLAENTGLPEETKAAHAIANIASYMEAFQKSRTGNAIDRNDIRGPLTVLIGACFPSVDGRALCTMMERPGSDTDRP